MPTTTGSSRAGSADGGLRAAPTKTCRRPATWLAAAVLLVATGIAQAQDTASPAPPATAPATLRDAQSFETIADAAERSKALFNEAGKVLQSPRCLNCHPNGDRPTQTTEMRLHQPMVVRGADNHGAVAMRCATCHQAANFDPSNVPGHPKWELAPLSMAWQGRTLGQICTQLKDRARNGGKTLAEIQEHMAHDSLVGWGWKPGGNREPAPGTQEQLGQLVDAWIKTGAVCPG